MYRWLSESVSVTCVVLLHITFCLAVAEEEESTGVEPFQWKRADPDSVWLVGGAQGPPPKCITYLGPCACQTDQGLIDLSPLDSKNDTKPFFENVTFTYWDKFSFNPCTPFSVKGKGCTDVAFCDCYGPTFKYCYTIGNHGTAKFQNDPSTQQLQIIYPSCGYAKSIVTLICDETIEGSIITTSSTYPTYKFTLTSKYACPKSPKPDSGSTRDGAIIFFIVFLTVVGVYVIGGILFICMYFARGARGGEKVSNVKLWMIDPDLLEDGGTFDIPSVKRDKATYEKI